MLLQLLLESKLEKLPPMGRNALELAVALTRRTVTVTVTSNQVFFTTSKPNYSKHFANCSPYLGGAPATIA